MGPDDEFGLYAFRVADGEHDHHTPLNLLGVPEHDSLSTWHGGRQWTIPSLKLWISIVRAGGAEGCQGFYIRIEEKR
jgi:hypothetical protein